MKKVSLLFLFSLILTVPNAVTNEPNKGKSNFVYYKTDGIYHESPTDNERRYELPEYHELELRKGKTNQSCSSVKMSRDSSVTPMDSISIANLKLSEPDNKNNARKSIIIKNDIRR